MDWLLNFCSTVGTTVFLLIGLTACGSGPPNDSLSVEETEEGYLVREGSDDVLFYQRAPKAKNGQYERSNYIHPLYGMDGTVLTEDFPSDHLHQRGIYWAWHQIYVGDRRVGDSWIMEDISWDIEDVQVRDFDSGSVGLQISSYWISPNWTDASGNQEPFVEETALIEIHRARAGMRMIDFEIQLRALEDSVLIGGSDNPKGYGGFSVRMRLPRGMEFTSREGPVTPQTTALDRGPWMDISGPLQENGGTSGIAILSHPSNRNHPQPWILREEASMQNPVFPGRELFPLPTEKPLTLRYRVVVHHGGADQIDLDALQQSYGSEEAVL